MKLLKLSDWFKVQESTEVLVTLQYFSEWKIYWSVDSWSFSEYLKFKFQKKKNKFRPDIVNRKPVEPLDLAGNLVFVAF